MVARGTGCPVSDDTDLSDLCGQQRSSMSWVSRPATSVLRVRRADGADIAADSFAARPVAVGDDAAFEASGLDQAEAQRRCQFRE